MVSIVSPYEYLFSLGQVDIAFRLIKRGLSFPPPGPVTLPMTWEAGIQVETSSFVVENAGGTDLPVLNASTLAGGEVRVEVDPGETPARVWYKGNSNVLQALAPNVHVVQDVQI